ncbi:MAG: response regulator, partial [Deltaproteobacteria bacterium]|nr:response regulator [Deltaproteobacteria bacterium]
MSARATTPAASVLLVDGTVSYRGVVASMLGQLGYRVTEVGDAEQAELAMKASTFEVAVVDEALPDRPGTDLIPALCALGPSTRILLVLGPESEVLSCEKLSESIGAAVVLRGPLHPNALTQRVDLLATKSPSQLPSDSEQPVSQEVQQQAEIAEQQLRILMRDYQEQLPAKLDQLAGLIRLARDPTADAEVYRELRSCAHGLHGTAGTLGFGEVSSVASRVEQAAKQVLAGAKSSDVPWERLNAALERAQSAPEKLSLLSSIPVRPGGIATVLVVDDDPDMLAAITEIGRRQLITVLGATTADQALDRTAEVRFDGAIIDINLGPGVSPFDLAE